ncbi:hypothetical protein [Longispora albida]|uniref:hypothetical protein n=1 Tax=Longispora albida TaxID=203523 RepID=UPI000364C3BC|nr:hypothetical protein [Longispora albida]
MNNPLRLLATATLLLLPVAGCSASSTPPSASPTTAVTVTSSASPSSPSSSSPKPSAPGATPSKPPAATVAPGVTPPPPKGEKTITGTVEAGVEQGCTLLKTSFETYLLLGGDRTHIREGARITVRGTAKPDLLTTCQQGVPFQVAEVRPAS